VAQTWTASKEKQSKAKQNNQAKQFSCKKKSKEQRANQYFLADSR
jgi:hypothetical protein